MTKPIDTAALRRLASGTETDRDVNLRVIAGPYESALLALRGEALRACDEIDALRRLPVIDTCTHCAFIGIEGNPMQNVCTNHDDDAEGRPVIHLQPVPTWCPLRRGAP